MAEQRKDERPKKEIERRMQDAIQRALNTPPKPFTKPARGKKERQEKAKPTPASQLTQQSQRQKSQKND